MKSSSSSPPAGSETSGKDSERPAKKAWSKPTILRLEAGVVVTENGPTVQTFPRENSAYHPPS